MTSPIMKRVWFTSSQEPDGTWKFVVVLDKIRQVREGFGYPDKKSADSAGYIEKQRVVNIIQKGGKL